jgi:phosphatidylglycerol:prolipoprotein diacylglycerol transferase
MLPYVVILGRSLPVYALAVLAGGLCAGFLACAMTRESGLRDSSAVSAMFIAAAGAFAGGHLLFALTRIPAAAETAAAVDGPPSLGDLAGIFGTLFGGMVFYGGLFGGLAAAFAYIRAKKLPVPVFSDIAAVSVPLFHAFGRIGCFCAGCCYGIPWEYGIASRAGTGAGEVRRFPVQLLEAALELCIFLVLFRLRRSHRADGRLLRLYFLMYGAVRFADEFLRGDVIRGFFLGLSTSQWISAAAVAAAAAAILTERRGGRGGRRETEQ